jgi:hypothetical protein
MLSLSILSEMGLAKTAARTSSSTNGGAVEGVVEGSYGGRAVRVRHFSAKRVLRPSACCCGPHHVSVPWVSGVRGGIGSCLKNRHRRRASSVRAARVRMRALCHSRHSFRNARSATRAFLMAEALFGGGAARARSNSWQTLLLCCSRTEFQFGLLRLGRRGNREDAARIASTRRRCFFSRQVPVRCHERSVVFTARPYSSHMSGVTSRQLTFGTCVRGNAMGEVQLRVASTGR